MSLSFGSSALSIVVDRHVVDTFQSVFFCLEEERVLLASLWTQKNKAWIKKHKSISFFCLFMVISHFQLQISWYIVDKFHAIYQYIANIAIYRISWYYHYRGPNIVNISYREVPISSQPYCWHICIDVSGNDVRYGH